MKTETPPGKSRVLRHHAWLVFCALLCGPLVFNVLSQEAKPVTAPATSSSASAPAKDSTADKPEKKVAPETRPTAYPPVSIAEVMKMIEAGVSPEIIKAYVANSPAAYDPNAVDLITLKTNGVPDDVTAALMKRVAEIKAINQKKKADQVAAQLSAGPSPVDPESYDFWWYNHGYPRVMSSTYRQLDAYPGGAYYSSGGYFYPGVSYSPMREFRTRPYGPGPYGPYGPGKRFSNRPR